MSDTKSTPLVHEFFEKNPETIFELVTILDINIKQEPYYFQVVFRNTKNNRFENVLIAPELLRRKYKVGYLYRNGHKVFTENNVLKKKIQISVNHLTIAQKNFKLFEEGYIHNGLNDYYNKFFLRQNAYKFDMGDYILIVPAYTVLLRFYFLSSSMKNAIMKNNVQGLCYAQQGYSTETKYIIQKDDTVEIHIKSTANKKDLPFLCRFLCNPLILKKISRYHYLSNYAKYDLAPIESHFPVEGEFTIAINYKILNHTIDGKPVYYCLNIYNDDSPLGFSKLLYKQYTAKQNPQDIAPSNFVVPKNGKRFTKRKPLYKDGVVRTGTPSSDNLFELLFARVEKDYNTLNLIIEGKNIYKEGGDNSRLEEELTNKKGSHSFEPPNKSGDEDLSPTGISEVAEDTEDKIFLLKDFLVFYEALLDEIGVEEIVVPELYHIEEMKNQKKNSINAKCVNMETKASRRYLFAVLEYDDKSVHIVEIEHDKSWAPSTWIFVSKSGNVYEEEVFATTLKKYMTEILSYEALKKHCMERYSLSFITHNHKKGEVDEIGIDNWCENLLGKIITV